MIREYLQSKGVKLEAQKPDGLKALDITLPVPARWTQVPDPNVRATGWSRFHCALPAGLSEADCNYRSKPVNRLEIELG
ncbi:hypothetical protein A5681_12785 [Mycobacterium scrofulaceum]|nr:hypothetical protein A5681_12785 [Mycobacterium scrofulaceum]